MEFQKKQQESVMAGSWIRGSVIGAGSFGTVSLAVSRVDGSLFAVKSIEVDPQHNGELQALENEMDILQSLSSPHVVRCLGGDWSTEMGKPAMRNAFLEYMPGGSITDLMSKFGGRLDEGLVRVYTRGILQGLSFLHSNAIVHCDIKGKNVLVGSTGVKLADFGSAKRIGSAGDCRIAAIKGTPLWMAPEVVRQEEQGPASDIWSLGCTVVEMLTGKAPWGDAASAFVALYRIGCSDEVPEMPSFLSSHGKDFLARCLCRDPSKRSTANELLRHPFVTGTGNEVAAAPATPVSPRSPLDFSRWQESSSSSNNSMGQSQLPFLSLKKKSSEQEVEGAEFACSPGKWIVVHSPQGRRQAEKAFDRLSDFNAVAEPALDRALPFPSPLDKIDEESSCNVSDEQVVVAVSSSSQSSESMATKDEITAPDSCSPSGQSEVVPEQLVSHSLFLGCGFEHSIHQDGSELVRFVEEFAASFTGFRSWPFPRMRRLARIKPKFKRVAHCRRLSLLEICRIVRHPCGRIFSWICHVRFEPELRERPLFKIALVSSLTSVEIVLPLNCCRLFVAMSASVVAFVCSLCVCCDWIELDGGSNQIHL